MTRSPFGDPTGDQLVDGVNDRFKVLFDASAFPLTGIGGTANAVTATLAPALDGDGLLDGMSFTITWAAANTDDVTLAINGGSPVPVLGPDGLALPPGAVGSGLRSLISYVGGDFVMLSPSLLMTAASGTNFAAWVFETSGTWTRPSWLDDQRGVLVEAWGGGGGGQASGTSSRGGGGGGAFARKVFLGSDLPSSVTVTVAPGAAAGSHGGNTTFGALLTAYGGRRGAQSSSQEFWGGGGGGEAEQGSNQLGGFFGGGNGTWHHTFQGVLVPRTQISSPFGGGGGGAGAVNDAAANDGGRAIWGGGGGGGGQGGGQGGASLHGGNGGSSGSAGQAPGGGGGRDAAGARGELRVVIL